MKILIDIGHPAHVHYFRNLIKLFIKDGDNVLVVARKKDVTQELLNYYNISYINRGKGGNGVFSKILYLLKADIFLLIKAIKFKPDILFSFSTIYPAHVSFLIKKPFIAITDTEHAKEQHKMFIPFCKAVLTPSSFKTNFGKKHYRFNSFMELAYLHPKYFKSSNSIKKQLGLNENERYCILRFVSWEASHDFGQKGIPFREKICLVSELSKYTKVFISSEKKLPLQFEKYRLKIMPHQIHNVLSAADLLYSEGATMSSEAVMLGTPTIFHNNFSFGTISEQNKYGLLWQYNLTRKGIQDGFKKAIEILKENNKEKYKEKANIILQEKLDPTNFLYWLIKNFPTSLQKMKENNKEYLQNNNEQ